MIDKLPARYSEDNVTNNQGFSMINFCKTANARIVNGRFGKCSELYTCKNASVVDYVVVSEDLFDVVSDFCVLDFDPLLSDIHCPVVVVLNSQVKLTQTDSNINKKKKLNTLKRMT